MYLYFTEDSFYRKALKMPVISVYLMVVVCIMKIQSIIFTPALQTNSENAGKVISQRNELHSHRDQQWDHAFQWAAHSCQ
jgi:hypothetical protein